MFIGGLVFAAVITAYAYNGDTNIFTFIGVLAKSVIRNFLTTKL
jgi:hypothetical protein